MSFKDKIIKKQTLRKNEKINFTLLINNVNVLNASSF